VAETFGVEPDRDELVGVALIPAAWGERLARKLIESELLAVSHWRSGQLLAVTLL
jgi:hypothetical protein